VSSVAVRCADFLLTDDGPPGDGPSTRPATASAAPSWQASDDQSNRTARFVHSDLWRMYPRAERWILIWLLARVTSPGQVFPPVVYVPCSPEQNSEELAVDLRRTRDGRLALLVYSAMDPLIAHCGSAQPWTVMLTRDLEQVRLATGVELIFLDLDVPPELRRTAGSN
jgi:hypothetical protein